MGWYFCLPTYGASLQSGSAHKREAQDKSSCHRVLMTEPFDSEPVVALLVLVGMHHYYHWKAPQDELQLRDP
jgi:hypothetical protein